MAARPPANPWALVRGAWERLSVYLPIILMGLMAMGSYWLVRNTPTFGPAETERAATHDPDYFMRGFTVRTFDANGRLKSEVFGTEARHFPDTDTLEIDQPRIRSFNARGELTVATARLALSNGDGSEVQLIGNAVVTREAATDTQGQARPRLEFRGEFLHAFMDTERVKSHKPVQITRGDNRFTADNLEFDNLDQVLELRGRVHGTLAPAARP
ncbi:MAG TPA: LPS export ABC transporter periplasmic protein LptC [Ramlibacter sp.]|nr:LPS export ABC transporter periplasmic protein LptC [Ramlibacter sp.]